MSILNMRYGSGKGGLKPVLDVFAPIGSTVTASKAKLNPEWHEGSTVPKYIEDLDAPKITGKYVHEDTKDYYHFDLPDTGFWFIQAAQGTVSDSAIQNIDAVGMYSLDFTGKEGNRQYLYNEGREYPLITGGWGQYNESNPAVKNDDNIYFSPPLNNHSGVYTVNKINRQSYTKLCGKTKVDAHRLERVYYGGDKGGNTSLYEFGNLGLGEKVWSVNLPTGFDERLMIYFSADVSKASNGYLYQLWLE